MNDEDVRKMLLRSNEMNGREQALWVVVFAQSGAFDLGAAVQADNAVKALRRLDPDELGPTTPEHLALAADHLAAQDQLLDLLAEELRLGQNALSEITGEFTSDDLLGVIFSKFCIGK
mgnify:CR=1 FL=1